MKRTSPTTPPAATPTVRCAVYTRKSTEEGLEKEFNSLDAQREAGEAYVKSQAGVGWTLVPTRYDDGGFTGGNTERPGLRRLLADIAAGRLDAVVVYKVDRLSRSLLDFAQLIQLFEKHQVAFVSVTQQFNTATSMGRLVLNVLLSFAQFEREIISERTRDKIAATRRKGKWAGGHPLLGYDVDPHSYKLVVNAAEAEQVRAIFALYQQHESLLPVVQELVRKGWVGKRWQTRKAGMRGGQPFTRTSLYRLLTNVAYLGQVKYKDEVHPGEHPAIVDPAVFQHVQALLRRNGTTGGTVVRNPFGALLKGRLRCVACNCAMTPTYTNRHGRRYPYYVCSSAQSRGRATCPAKSLPAEPIETFVVDHIRCVGRDPELLRDVLAAARSQIEAETAGGRAEERTLTTDLAAWGRDLARLAGAGRSGGDDAAIAARLAEGHDRIAAAEERLREVRGLLATEADRLLPDDEAARALAAFDPVWGTLTPAEQARVIGLLVERVEYDGRDGRVTVAFHPTGIRTLAGELAGNPQKECA